MYEISEGWTGGMWCGITLERDYENLTVGFSMPGYIKNVQQKHLHEKLATPQHSPYQCAPRKFGIAAQQPMAHDGSPEATSAKITIIQGIVGSII